MTFRWDWLLVQMTGTGILDYYQVNVCDNYTDFVLYKMGRGKGVVMYECHIIKRTSASCYRITSFYDYKTYYRSCGNALQVCNYIITFIPEYIFRPGVELRAERASKREEYTSVDTDIKNHGHGYLGENEDSISNPYRRKSKKNSC